jgi:hypothetical protein
LRLRTADPRLGDLQIGVVLQRFGGEFVQLRIVVAFDPIGRGPRTVRAWADGSRERVGGRFERLDVRVQAGIAHAAVERRGNQNQQRRSREEEAF